MGRTPLSILRAVSGQSGPFRWIFSGSIRVPRQTKRIPVFGSAPECDDAVLTLSGAAMNSSDDDFDTDHPFDEDDTSLEAQVWQLLLLINPGDDDAALQQFAGYSDAVGDTHDDDIDVAQVVGEVADWRSTFHVDAEDTHALVQAIDELGARWNLAIDWNGDPDDDDFHAHVDAAELLAIAYDNLAPHGYTLWLRETDDDSLAGWITLSRDVEPMRELARELGVHLRLGSEAG